MAKIKNKKLKIAVFDIDGTIFRSSLLIELVNGLVKDRIFLKKAEDEIEDDYHAWLNRVANYDSYINKVAEVYFRHIVGCKKKEVLEVGKKVMAKQKLKVYRFTRDLVKDLKKQGYYLIAISGSPMFMVKDFAKRMGFDMAFGSDLEVKDGMFTNKFTQRDSYNQKSKLLMKIVENLNIDPDWKKSVAVGDSATDISMLELVGKPIAFNPDGVLVDYAKKHGWRIVVERKNIVYDIEKFDFVHYKDQ